MCLQKMQGEWLKKEDSVLCRAEPARFLDLKLIRRGMCMYLCFYNKNIFLDGEPHWSTTENTLRITLYYCCKVPSRDRARYKMVTADLVRFSDHNQLVTLEQLQ